MGEKVLFWARSDFGKGFISGSACLAAVLVCFVLWHRNKSDLLGNPGVDAGIAAIGGQQQAASAAVGGAVAAGAAAQEALSSAGSGVSSVQVRIGTGAALAESNLAEVSAIAGELKSCAALARKNAELIVQLGGSNQNGASQSSGR